MLKTWSDGYALGIQTIDEQHKGFFEASHRLYDAIMNCEGEKMVEESVAFLRDHANRHLQTEESYITKHAYPHLEQRKKLHTEFLEVLYGLVDDLALFGQANTWLTVLWGSSRNGWSTHHLGGHPICALYQRDNLLLE